MPLDGSRAAGPSAGRRLPLRNRPVQTYLESPANWFAMACAGLAALLLVSGLVDPGPWLASLMIVGAYGLGFGAGCLMFGFDGAAADQSANQAGAIGDGRHRMVASIAGVRRVIADNPGKRLKRPLREQLKALCDDVDALVRLLDEHRGALSPEQAFRAEQIATRYLPDALRTFLAIPKSFATTEKLDNGRTALETLAAALVDLSAQTRSLKAELVREGARDLVNQAAFLEQKARQGGGRSDQG